MRVEVHDDHLPPDAPDEDWIALVGRKGWVALTKDKNLRHRSAEIQSIRNHATFVVVIRAKNATGAEIAESVVQGRSRIARMAASVAPPHVARLDRRGRLEPYPGLSKRSAFLGYDERGAPSQGQRGAPMGSTIAERILLGAAHLAGRSGSGRFSRVDVRDHLGIDPDVWHRSYNPIFQGMREDHPGGAPRVGERYGRVFRRVERASYELSAKGRTLVQQLKSVGDRPGNEG